MNKRQSTTAKITKTIACRLTDFCRLSGGGIMVRLKGEEIGVYSLSVSEFRQYNIYKETLAQIDAWLERYDTFGDGVTVEPMKPLYGIIRVMLHNANYSRIVDVSSHTLAVLNKDDDIDNVCGFCSAFVLFNNGICSGHRLTYAARHKLQVGAYYIAPKQ